MNKIKHSNDLIIIKTDKNNAMVVISNKELDTKTNKFINKYNCIILNKDPPEKYQTKITNLLSSSIKIVNPENI